MSNNLSTIPAGPEALGADGRSPPRQNPRRQPASAPAPEAEAEHPVAPDAGQRLVIREDEETGALVYTVIDRASGQVVAQTPREEVARMSQRADYTAGALISARA